MWTAPDCAPLKTLKGHDGKVMSVDASPGAKQRVATEGRKRKLASWWKTKIAGLRLNRMLACIVLAAVC